MCSATLRVVSRDVTSDEAWAVIGPLFPQTHQGRAAGVLNPDTYAAGDALVSQAYVVRVGRGCQPELPLRL